jgi:TPR repeat protein
MKIRLGSKDDWKAVLKEAILANNPVAEAIVAVCYILPADDLILDENLSMMFGERAVPALRQRAQDMCQYSQFFLGLFHEYGIAVRKDPPEAFRLMNLSARQGNAAAQNCLGNYFGRGFFVSKDQLESVRWYKQSCDQNYAFAQFNLAKRYLSGPMEHQSTKEAKKEAVRLFRTAADQEHTEARNCLGECYRDGVGMVKDEREAVRLFRVSADAGNPRGQTLLAHQYIAGSVAIVVGNSYSSAVEIFFQGSILLLA